MGAVTKEIQIHAAPEKVFAYVADFSRHPEWATYPLKVTAPAGSATTGTAYDSVGHQMGRDIADHVTVKEVVPNQRLVYEASGSSGTFRHVMELKAANGGTVLRKSFEAVSLPLMGKLMFPVVKRTLVPKGLQTDLEKIKAKVE